MKKNERHERRKGNYLIDAHVAMIYTDLHDEWVRETANPIEGGIGIIDSENNSILFLVCGFHLFLSDVDVDIHTGHHLYSLLINRFVEKCSFRFFVCEFSIGVIQWMNSLA